MNNVTELSGEEFVFSYLDTCPSELIHNAADGIISIGLISFLNINANALPKIKQFKNTRGLERRIRTQNLIIQAIKSGNLLPVGVISWNYKNTALKNGEFILKENRITNETISYDEKLEINGNYISYGHLISLAWYSIALYVLAKNVGEIASLRNKSKAMILLDLLPGDNINFRKNLHLITYIIDNTFLKESFREIATNYQLTKFGFAYGIKEGSTKSMKNDIEFTVTDWIVQSFNSLVLYEKRGLDKNSPEYQLSNLATFLHSNDLIKISDTFLLVDN